MSRFDDLFWLVEALDAGTLSGAAEKHGISNAAVSKRIKQLEDRLGVSLLVRSSRHLRATEAGELFYKRGKLLLEEFDELEQNVASTSERLTGTIRINAPLSFGLKKITRPVNDFLALYPDVSIELQLDDSFIDIQNNDYDLVIRVGTLEDSAIVAQRISSANFVCCASPAYLKKHGEPRKPQELKNHNCLVYNPGSAFRKWMFNDQGEPLTVSVSGNLVSNNGALLADSVIAGSGIAYLPDFIIGDAIADGTAKPILCNHIVDSVNAYALYPSRHYLPLKIKRLIEFLKSELN